MTVEKSTLPSMSCTFSVNVKGKETGKIYEGQFTYTRPNLRQKAEINKMSTRLNGDMQNLPIDIVNYNNITAILFHCLTDAPDWWVKSNYGADLYDYEVVEAIYKATTDFETEWHKKVYGDEDLNKKVYGDEDLNKKVYGDEDLNKKDLSK